MSRGEHPDEWEGQEQGRQPHPKLPGRHFLAKGMATLVARWVGGRTNSEKNGLGNVTADVQVLDVFTSLAQRLQLYLCQLRANDSNNTQSPTNPPPWAPRDAGSSSQGWHFAGRSCACLFFFRACSGPDTPPSLKRFPCCTDGVNWS